jgi:hypothetical protein
MGDFNAEHTEATGKTSDTFHKEKESAEELGDRRDDDEEQWLNEMDDMLNKHVDQTKGAMIESAQALRLAGKAISVAREAREGLAVMRERLYA